MRRITKIKPGFDCTKGKCEVEGVTPERKRRCETTDGGNHGASGDEWYFVVTDDEFALSLSVLTSSYRGDRDHFRFPARRVRGAYLSGHAIWPQQEEEVRSGRPNDCEWMASEKCYESGSSYRAADTFFTEHGDQDRQEQPETFWAAMEAEHAERKQRAIANRVDLAWRRCEARDGRGIVNVDATGCDGVQLLRHEDGDGDPVGSARGVYRLLGLAGERLSRARDCYANDRPAEAARLLREGAEFAGAAAEACDAAFLAGGSADPRPA